MKTSVVILNWNGARMMQKFLPSVVEHTKEYADTEIVVADNGSTDDSLVVLQKEFPTVRIVTLDKNYGFAEGYNRAIHAIEAEYIVLLNSDIETTEGWLHPLTDYLDTHADVVACQPKLMAHYDREKFEYAGGAGGYIDRFGYPFCRGRIFGITEKDNGQYDSEEPCDILWATGACLVIRRKEYIEAGGLDARFFAHNEEIDLCWRLRLYGKRIVCISNSKVYHLGGGTLPQGNPRKTYLNFRNNLTMLYKNLPEQELHSVMRWRMVLDYVAALQSLLTGKWGDVKAIYKARRDFRRWKPEYKEIRYNIQQHSISTNIPERKHYSILWKYYVLGKKHYSEL